MFVKGCDVLYFFGVFVFNFGVKLLFCDDFYVICCFFFLLFLGVWYVCVIDEFEMFFDVGLVIILIFVSNVRIVFIIVLVWFNWVDKFNLNKFVICLINSNNVLIKLVSIVLFLNFNF